MVYSITSWGMQSTCVWLTERVWECQRCSGKHGIENITSIRRRVLWEAISGIIDRMQLNSGCSISCTEDQQNSSSKGSALTSSLKSGWDWLGCHLQFTLLDHVSGKENTITMPTTTSISVIDHHQQSIADTDIFNSFIIDLHTWFHFEILISTS